MRSRFVDDADGFAWRALAIATPKTGGMPTVYPISLDWSSAGSISIPSFGTMWPKIMLVPTIVGTEGSAGDVLVRCDDELDRVVIRSAGAASRRNNPLSQQKKANDNRDRIARIGRMNGMAHGRPR